MQFRGSIYYSYCKVASSMQWYRLRLIITVDVATLCNHWTGLDQCTDLCPQNSAQKNDALWTKMNKSSCLIDQERDLKHALQLCIFTLIAGLWEMETWAILSSFCLHSCWWLCPCRLTGFLTLLSGVLFATVLLTQIFFFSVIFCLAYSQSICPLNCSSLALTLQASVEISREDRVVRLHVFLGAITSGRMAYLGRGRLMFAPHSVCNYFCRVHSLAMNLFILLQEFKTLPLLLIPHHLMGFWVLF